jgi:hypothetical protein
MEEFCHLIGMLAQLNQKRTAAIKLMAKRDLEPHGFSHFSFFPSLYTPGTCGI